jgi:hypothetical protein
MTPGVVPTYPGITITYDDKDSGSGYIALYKGDCSSLTLVDCRTERSSSEAGKFQMLNVKAGIGDVYYIRIGSTSTATNQTLVVNCYDKLH